MIYSFLTKTSEIVSKIRKTERMPYTSTAESIYNLVEKGKSGLKATNLHSRRMSDSIWILTNEDIIICNFWISGKRLLFFLVPATLVVLGPSYMVLGTWDNPPPETTLVSV